MKLYYPVDLPESVLIFRAPIDSDLEFLKESFLSDYPIFIMKALHYKEKLEAEGKEIYHTEYNLIVCEDGYYMTTDPEKYFEVQGPDAHYIEAK